MPISNYSTTAASNTSLFPEGQTPSSLNDGMRTVQSDIRSWYESAEWVDYGNTPTYVSATSFTVATDLTAKYVQHRRIRCTDASTLYGTITSSSYSAPNTTVNVTLDSGSLSASLTAIALSSQMPSNVSVPSTIGRQGSTIASATTTDIGAATGDYIDISGTTTITGLGTIAAGVMRTVRFTGALTLTYNATSLILPGAANITTANGDTAIFRSLGSGNWLCISYIKAAGTAIVVGSQGTDIASAATTNIGAATGDYVNITGTTTITSFGTITAGVARTVKFTGALTLTYNATSLILPTAANITTANGDTAIFRSLGSGNWICVSYVKANGAPLGPFIDSGPIVVNSSDATKKLQYSLGNLTTSSTRNWTIPDSDIGRFVIQSTSTEPTAAATGTTIIPLDDTIPQNTEGDQYMSLSITPKNANNILVIDIVWQGTNSATATIAVALFQDATANSLSAATAVVATGTYKATITFRHIMVAGTTSSTTFKVRAGGNTAGTTTFNGSGGTRQLGGVMSSSILITEYSA